MFLQGFLEKMQHKNECLQVFYNKILGIMMEVLYVLQQNLEKTEAKFLFLQDIYNKKKNKMF